MSPTSKRSPRASRRRASLALRDGVLLQVEPDELHLAAVHRREQVVQGERQVGAARAEVDDAQASFGKPVEHVADQLEEAVHLAILRVALPVDRAGRRHHAERDEKRHRLALREHAALLPVVLQPRARAGRRPAQHLRAPAAGEDLPVGVNGV
jgi:hypothetical protein